MRYVRALIVAVVGALLLALTATQGANAATTHRHSHHPCAGIHNHAKRRACRIKHHLFPVSPPLHKAATTADSNLPNIVLILADDFSSNLIQYMPNVLDLEKRGMTFTNNTVADSLCCPSRTSIFTGMYPHDHGVKDNTASQQGGWSQFQAEGDEDLTFAPPLYSAGYTTGFIGKYLNEYPAASAPAKIQTGWPDSDSNNPPGWSYWAGSANGYNGYNYDIAFDHQVTHYGSDNSDYATTVEGNLASAFIDRNLTAGRPFFLEMAPFAPHVATGPRDPSDQHFAYNYEMAPGDYNCAAGQGITYPAGDDWNTISNDAPMWERDLPAWGSGMLSKFTEDFRQRVCAVQAIDRQVGRLRDQLMDAGQWLNTYFIFTSDNGLHMGEHRLNENKMTAFDSDVNVPLIIHGPPGAVVPNTRDDHYVQNIDLAPTFERIAGKIPGDAVDGHSLLPLLNQSTNEWRAFSVIEHRHPTDSSSDPDAESNPDFNPPSYVALRGINIATGVNYTYVQYSDGEHEYYNRDADPDEVNNLYPTLTDQRRQELIGFVADAEACQGYGANPCWGSTNPRVYP